MTGHFKSKPVSDGIESPPRSSSQIHVYRFRTQRKAQKESRSKNRAHYTAVGAQSRPFVADESGPLTMTRAPSAASALAIAKPIPAVEPLTRANLFSSWRFMFEIESSQSNIARAFLARGDAAQLSYMFN